VSRSSSLSPFTLPLATIYHALGIEPDVEAIDPQGRPVRLCLGSAIPTLFG
jgi:hypothetical protein